MLARGLHLHGAREEREGQQDRAERAAKLAARFTALTKRSTTEDAEDTEEKSSTGAHLKSRRENTVIAITSIIAM
jgi:hypothetical protein